MVRSRSAERGFSLIEVLVAFVIFALVGGVALQTVSTVLRGSDAAQHRLEGMAVAKSLAARLGIDIPLDGGRTTGTDPSGEYSWEIRQTFMADEIAGVRPVHAEIRVFPKERPERVIELETAVLGGPGVP